MWLITTVSTFVECLSIGYWFFAFLHDFLFTCFPGYVLSRARYWISKNSCSKNLKSMIILYFFRENLYILPSHSNINHSHHLNLSSRPEISCDYLGDVNWSKALNTHKIYFISGPPDTDSVSFQGLKVRSGLWVSLYLEGPRIWLQCYTPKDFQKPILVEYAFNWHMPIGQRGHWMPAYFCVCVCVCFNLKKKNWLKIYLISFSMLSRILWYITLYYIILYYIIYYLGFLVIWFLNNYGSELVHLIEA